MQDWHKKNGKKENKRDTERVRKRVWGFWRKIKKRVTSKNTFKKRAK